MKLSKKDAFTMTEILVAIVILGVMAGLAVPSYRTTIRQSEANEARANLNVIFMAQRIFFLNNNRCWPVGGATTAMASATDATNLALINTGLSTEMTTSRYAITVTSGSGAGAIADFTADAALGNTGGKVFHISRLLKNFAGVDYAGGTVYPPEGEGTYA